jgi:molecular chaperone DnaK (HSP70)
MRSIGIDLGISNSRAAAPHGGRSTIIPSVEGVTFS